MKRYVRGTRGEPVAWSRGFARHERGDIVLTDLQEYQPMAHKGMVFELARVRTPDDAAAFASKYGLLRHGPDVEDFREPFSEWDEEALYMRMVLRLYVLLGQALDGDDAARQELREPWRSTMAGYFQEPAQSDDEILIQGSVFLAWAVNEKLAGMESGITAACQWEGGEAGQFLIQPRPKDLLGYIYHELSLLIVNRQEARTCEECNVVFPVEDQRQRFCSTSCANRARYRRWSEKRRQTQ